MTSLETLRDNVPGAWRYARSWLIELADELLQIQGGVPPTQSYVTLTGQALAPANPSVGDFRLYFTTTNLLRSVDGGGVIREYVDLANTQTISGAKTFSGTLSVTGTLSASKAASNAVTIASTGSSVQLILNGAASFGKVLELHTGGLLRWDLRSNATPESGSNAGSDLIINRYNDAGVSLGFALSIVRATGAVSLAGATTITFTDGTTAALVSPLSVRAFSTGTPAANYGISLPFNAHSSTNTNRNLTEFRFFWVDPIDGTRKARGQWLISDTVAREAIRVEASGTAAMIGFLGAAAIARPNVTGSRGGNAALASFLTALANLGLITDSTTA